jgi:hypothetical protein
MESTSRGVGPLDTVSATVGNRADLNPRFETGASISEWLVVGESTSSIKGGQSLDPYEPETRAHIESLVRSPGAPPGEIGSTLHGARSFVTETVISRCLAKCSLVFQPVFAPHALRALIKL